MLKQDLQILACPACGAARLGHRPAVEARPVPPGFDPQTMLWDGALVCGQCSAGYPLLEGVACMAVFDRGWAVPLKEAESRIALSMRLTEPQQWEPGRQEAYDQQEREVLEVMDFLFKVALEQIDFSKRPLILDVGCGGGRTSDRFAALGGRVFAADVDLGQLRYISFKGVDELPPYTWSHPASGRVFPDKEPQALDHYFTRVFSDVGRLPFPDGAFDVVFCRSVLHHLDDHPRVMREMARVLRPGGRMIFCSEPMRSPLTDERECMVENVQCEEGMNERVWPLWQYLGPVWRYSRDVMVHTWPTQPTTRSLRRRTLGLGGWINRKIGPGAQVRGLKLLAMPLVEASINIYATRNERPMAGAPAQASNNQDALPAEDLREFVELYRVTPHGEGEGVADLPRKRSVIGRLRRKLLAGDSRLPVALDLGQALQHELDRGWLAPQEHAGKTGRVVAREAGLTLRRAPGAQVVTLECALATGDEIALTLWGNDAHAGQVRVAGTHWRELHFELPRDVQDSVLSLGLRTDTLSAHDATQEHAQLIVSAIRQH